MNEVVIFDKAASDCLFQRKLEDNIAEISKERIRAFLIVLPYGCGGER